MATEILPRLLRLLELLGRGSPVPGPQLADELGVDGRTLRRDVERLRGLGYEVAARRGRHGGYALARRSALPPLVLSEEQATALVLGLDAAQRAGVRVDDADGLAARLLRLLPADVADGVDAVRSALDLRTPGRLDALPAARLLALARAVRDGRAVALRYVDRAGSTTERTVDAWALVQRGRRWYLLGHDRLRDDVRTLRADRVVGLLDGGEREVAPPDGLDAAAWVDEQVTVAAWAHEVEVLFHAAPGAVRRRLPAGVGELVAQPDGSTLLRTGADDLAGMACLVAGTGLPCEVQRPSVLADELVALGDRLTAAHADRDAGA